MRLTHGTDRRPVAVVITSDGRRVPVVLPDGGLVDLSIVAILRSLVVGVLGLIRPITGSRREDGGAR